MYTDTLAGNGVCKRAGIHTEKVDLASQTDGVSHSASSSSVVTPCFAEGLWEFNVLSMVFRNICLNLDFL